MSRPTTLPIGENVRSRRRAQGYSLTELARRARVSKAYLSQMENYPEKQPSVEIVYRLAQALQVNITDLMGIATANDDPGDDAAHCGTNETANDTLNGAAAGDSPLPIALQLFWAENPGIPAADIAGLANLSCRGWCPATPTDYWLIYESIRSTASPYQPKN